MKYEHVFSSVSFRRRAASLHSTRASFSNSVAGRSAPLKSLSAVNLKLRDRLRSARAAEEPPLAPRRLFV